MEIALVRGPSWTPWEAQSFEPLAARHRVTAFVTSGAPLAAAAGGNVAVQRCASLDQAFPSNAALRRLVNGATSRLLGFSHSMRGLETALADYAIVHGLEAHNTFTFQGLEARRRSSRKRLVVTVWETLARRGESHPRRRSRKRAVLHEADAFHVVSERSRHMLEAEGVAPERIHVIPLGVSLERFEGRSRLQARNLWTLGVEDFVIACVARLVPEKGVYDVLEAVGRLRGKRGRPALKLIYVGTGPEETGLRRRAEALGLTANVRWTGALPYSRIPELLAAADCSVLASKPTRIWEEQFGYALVESMAAGCPLVSTRSGAIPEVVGAGGILVEPGSVDELAGALEKLIGDAGFRERLGAGGRAWARERYDARRVAERLEALYVGLLKSAQEKNG